MSKQFLKHNCSAPQARSMPTNNSLKANDGILLHADNYCEADIEQLISVHTNRPSNCDLTMLAFRTQTPHTCGILEVDNQKILNQMYEKSHDDHGNLANAAFMFFQRS
ncbi:MAG: hypothetical protein EBQ64_04260 [Acidimicrobiia bacterium]|nr:hypothetical protein [Acidimicrobiia bacterium]